MTLIFNPYALYHSVATYVPLGIMLPFGKRSKSRNVQTLWNEQVGIDVELGVGAKLLGREVGRDVGKVVGKRVGKGVGIEVGCEVGVSRLVNCRLVGSVVTVLVGDSFDEFLEVAMLVSFMMSTGFIDGNKDADSEGDIDGEVDGEVEGVTEGNSTISMDALAGTSISFVVARMGSVLIGSTWSVGESKSGIG
jgi:hypothetical protein